jgi:hypothetical protein
LRMSAVPGIEFLSMKAAASCILRRQLISFLGDRDHGVDSTEV